MYETWMFIKQLSEEKTRLVSGKLKDEGMRMENCQKKTTELSAVRTYKVKS